MTHPSMVHTSKWLLAEEALLLPGTRVQFHVGPSSTRPCSANSLPKHRGHCSGSSSRCLLRHGVYFVDVILDVMRITINLD